MKKYEIMYIVNSSLEASKSAEVIENLHAIITSNNGVIDNVDDWGVREFAYEINKQTKGHYVVLTVTAPVEAISEFDRLSRINSNVVRTMIIRLED